MVLRKRPLVFLSSTIGELADIRSKVKDQLDGLALVDSWLFEHHAAASGSAPDEQYLTYARTCEVYVLIVADQESPATEAEYKAAVLDNPDKVLPFFIGPDQGPTAVFRETVAKRHTYVRVAHQEDLRDVIVTAIQHSIVSGSLVVPSLLENLLQQLSRSSSLLNLPLEFLHSVEFKEGQSEVLSLDECVGSHGRVLLTGEAGTGKSHAMLVSLFRLSQASKRLPLYLSVLEDTESIDGLIESAFDSVQFHPGQDLTKQYAREGRLLIGIDGYDELSGDSRKRLVRLIGAYADRYPRCSFVLAARLLDARVLPAFRPVSMSALSDAQLSDAFSAYGYPQVQPDRDLSTELADLARRPFWLGALLNGGLSPGSPLEVLQKLIEARLAQAEPAGDLERVRTRRAAGTVAVRARPSAQIALPDALESLRAWASEEDTQATFGQLSAARYLDDISSTGLTNTADGTVQFAHSLVAAVLAGEELVRRGDLSQVTTNDVELLPLITALAADSQPRQVIDLLAESDVVVVARTLRLLSKRQNHRDLESDAPRYVDALARLGPLVGPSTPMDVESEAIEFATNGEWLAMASSSTIKISTMTESEFERWSKSAITRSGHLVVWPTNPFIDMTPEFVAAAETVLRFKERLASLRPSGDPYDRAEPKVVERLMRRTTQRDERLVTTVLARRQYRDDLLKECGLDRSQHFESPVGMPLIELFPHGTGARVRVSWGHEAPTVRVRQGAGEDRWYDDLSEYLVDDHKPRAYQELLHQIEGVLGTPLSIGTWHQPGLVAGWNW